MLNKTRNTIFSVDYCVDLFIYFTAHTYFVKINTLSELKQ